MRQRMVAPHHADIVAVKQALVAKQDVAAGLGAGGQVAHHGREVADRQVGLLFIQQGAWIAGRQRHHAQGDARRFDAHHAHQVGHQFGSGGVGHGQHESLAGAGRVEHAGRQAALQLGQSGAHGRPDFQRVGGWLEAASLAYQQFVAQGFTAGWVSARRLAARVRLRSDMTSSNTLSKFRSKVRRLKGVDGSGIAIY